MLFFLERRILLVTVHSQPAGGGEKRGGAVEDHLSEMLHYHRFPALFCSQRRNFLTTFPAGAGVDLGRAAEAHLSERDVITSKVLYVVFS